MYAAAIRSSICSSRREHRLDISRIRRKASGVACRVPISPNCDFNELASRSDTHEISAMKKPCVPAALSQCALILVDGGNKKFAPEPYIASPTDPQYVCAVCSDGTDLLHRETSDARCDIRAHCKEHSRRYCVVSRNLPRIHQGLSGKPLILIPWCGIHRPTTPVKCRSARIPPRRIAKVDINYREWEQRGLTPRPLMEAYPQISIGRDEPPQWVARTRHCHVAQCVKALPVQLLDELNGARTLPLRPHRFNDTLRDRYRSAHVRGSHELNAIHGHRYAGDSTCGFLGISDGNPSEMH